VAIAAAVVAVLLVLATAVAFCVGLLAGILGTTLWSGRSPGQRREPPALSKDIDSIGIELDYHPERIADVAVELGITVDALREWHRVWRLARGGPRM